MGSKVVCGSNFKSSADCLGDCVLHIFKTWCHDSPLLVLAYTFISVLVFDLVLMSQGCLKDKTQWYYSILSGEVQHCVVGLYVGPVVHRMLFISLVCLQEILDKFQDLAEFF